MTPLPDAVDVTLKNEMLREHLLIATRHMNRDELNKALRDYMASGLPVDCREVEEASRKLDVLATRDGESKFLQHDTEICKAVSFAAIKDATRTRNLDLLRKYLRGIREQEDAMRAQAQQEGREFEREEGVSVYMEFELQEAKKVLRDEAARDRRKLSDLNVSLSKSAYELKT